MAINKESSNDPYNSYTVTGVTIPSFRWEDVAKNTTLAMGNTEKGIGINVRVSMGKCNVTVCRHLHLSMGNISEAIVFDKVHCVMGRIDEIHCLHSTEQNICMGSTGKITYHTMDELVALAVERTGMN